MLKVPMKTWINTSEVKKTHGKWQPYTQMIASDFVIHRIYLLSFNKSR